MLLISVRFSPKFSFSGQVAECEVQAMDTEFNIKRTFAGTTLKEAFDKFKNDDVTCLQN